ncbi:CRAL-TRIO domain-containing protein [Escovopsis weberi]|uniref:CRAL-TRIO domain-containing protein n=1 Tax=Escovopsis weberi TaxID=150374 RepID=A0A0M8N0F2_ESCWE|nr:CRAL-TRIO domain-containing protein [Escovopsis weberi]
MAEETQAMKLPIPAPAAESAPLPRATLTDTQKAMYATVLDKVAALTEVACSSKHADKSGPLTDAERAWLSRDCILRYLRAAKWNAASAFERVVATLVWRREYELDGFTADYISPEQETGKQLILGFDKEGRPCLYLNPGRQNTHTSQRQVHHMFFMVERLIDVMPPGVETLALMINFKQSKTKYPQSVSMSMSREVLHILQNHYPERLGRCLIINVHWVIQGFFKLINPFIDPVSRAKLKFNEDMRQYVPPEQLWSADWDGELDFDYDHEAYWPALMEMCRQKKEARIARWEAAGKHIGESEDYMAGSTDESVFGFKFDAAAAKEGGKAVEKTVEETVEEKVEVNTEGKIEEEVKTEVETEVKTEEKIEEKVEVKTEETVEEKVVEKMAEVKLENGAVPA